MQIWHFFLVRGAVLKGNFIRPGRNGGDVYKRQLLEQLPEDFLVAAPCRRVERAFGTVVDT